MAAHVVGMFDRPDFAHRAIQETLTLGIPSTQISVLAHDPDGKLLRRHIDHSGNLAGEGAVAGATSGAVVGGVIGLLIGTGVLTFTGLGIAAVGPLAGLITGAGIGAVSGGILGALIGLGIPEEHAHTYAEGLRRGATLVTVNTDSDVAPRVQEIFTRNGAVDIKQRADLYRSQGWHKFDPNAQPYSPEEAIAEQNMIGQATPAMGSAMTYTAVPRVQPEMHDSDTDFRRDFDLRYAGTNLTYDQVRPAYEYGHKLHSDPRFKEQDWSTIEGSLHEEWERTNPGTWMMYRDAIQEGFVRARMRMNNAGARMM